jgi:hypothetical protein
MLIAQWTSWVLVRLLQGIWKDLPVGENKPVYISWLFQKNVPKTLLAQGFSFGDMTRCHSVLCRFVVGSKWWNWLSRRSVGSNGSGQHEAILIGAAFVFSGETNGNTGSAITTSLLSRHWVEFQCTLLFLDLASRWMGAADSAGRSCCSTARLNGDAHSVAFEAFQPVPHADISIHTTKSIDSMFN